MSWGDALGSRPQQREQAPAPVPRVRVAAADESRERKWALAALESECGELRTTPEGARNDRLNAAAFALGQIVGGGYLSDGEAWEALREAARSCGLGASETDKTISSGLEAGKHEPRHPERRSPPLRPMNGAPSTAEPASGEIEHDSFEHDDEHAPDAPPGDEAPAGEPQPAPARLRSLGELLPAAMQLAERRRTGEVSPVPVPWRAYEDALAGGLWPGMHVLVAGTGFGKTQFEMQIGLHAALRGTPVMYIGLELDEPQVALRMLGEDASVRWSNLYTGRYTDRELERAREAVPKLSELPVYVETGPPNGWPASQLAHLAAAMRRQHPSGPMLLVVDFLQLVGDEPLSERRVELRERIGRAAYQARHVARTYDASVVLVSSAARDKYGLLAGRLTDAGLGSMVQPGRAEPSRTLSNPDALVGLGKESGEIEFAADSVTVLARWPTGLPSGERCYIAAVPKLRYGPATWFGMRFAWRFEELPLRDVDDLPELPKGERGGRKPVDSDEYRARVLATLRARGPQTSKRQIAKLTEGKDRHVLAAVDALVADGLVSVDERGVYTAAETDPREAP